MSCIISDYILTPLADGTQNNLQALLKDQSSIQKHHGIYENTEPFYASIFNREKYSYADLNSNDYSFFELLAIQVIRKAIDKQNIDVTRPDVIFILSSTKGNIEYIGLQKDVHLVTSAKKISAFFRNPNLPIVVSNACISGCCALILADRLIRIGFFKTAVVVGCDVLSPFIISGFQSLKALATDWCRPFDQERAGLNLGEASACIVLSDDNKYKNKAYGRIIDGSIHNDANHISAPSRTGEGAYLCLNDVLQYNKNDVAFINLHGTATLYNDEMEAVAIERATASDIPVNSLKGFFGHTLGTAGVLETVLSLHALINNIVLPTKGYNTQGTTHHMNITNIVRHTDKNDFIKLISGFGGCNATIRISKNNKPSPSLTTPQLKTIHTASITPSKLILDDTCIDTNHNTENFLTTLYKKYVGDYPKFYKMDPFCQLGFILCEIVLQATNEERFVPRSDRAIIMTSEYGCILNDRAYANTFSDSQNYFPSPALFTYTLPNIVTGEMAIRNKYYGETSFYLLDNKHQLNNLITSSFTTNNTRSALIGRIDYPSYNDFKGQLSLVIRC